MTDKTKISDFRISSLIYKYETNAELKLIIELLDGHLHNNRANRKYLNSVMGIVVLNPEILQNDDEPDELLNILTIVPMDIIKNAFNGRI